MAENTIQNYPYWSPQGAGSAVRFADPWQLTAIQLLGHLEEAEYLDVPQETQYSQRNVPFRQEVVPIVPEPQAPAHVPDPYAQSRSLLDYATQTLGGARLGVEDQRGQAGETDITGR